MEAFQNFPKSSLCKSAPWQYLSLCPRPIYKLLGELQALPRAVFSTTICALARTIVFQLSCLSVVLLTGCRFTICTKIQVFARLSLVNSGSCYSKFCQRWWRLCKIIFDRVLRTRESMAPTTSTASAAFASTLLRYIIFIVLLTLAHQAQAVPTIDDWRSRSIYQIITDRFARPDGSTTAPCVIADNQYCGGTWQGVIKKLDYIQGMGFTAVS